MAQSTRESRLQAAIAGVRQAYGLLSANLLMMSGIRKVLIISTPEHLCLYEELFGASDSLGMKFSYKVQEEPRGIAQALILGEEFLRGHPSALVLGDNVIFVDGLQSRLIKANQRSAGATVFACDVANLQNYGVIEFGID